MKSIVVAIGLLLSCGQVWAQGTVYFYNHVPSAGLDAPVYDTDGKTPLLGAQFQAQLYAGASAESLGPVGAVAYFTSQPGYWLNYDGSLTRIIPGVAAGSVAYAQVRVWSSYSGTTYERAAAVNGKHGQSTVFTVLTGGDTQGGTEPPSFPGYLTELRSFNLTGVDPVPEPSTMALLLVAGAGALLWGSRNRR
jgi:hypothetical protein